MNNEVRYLNFDVDGLDFYRDFEDEDGTNRRIRVDVVYYDKAIDGLVDKRLVITIGEFLNRLGFEDIKKERF